MPTAVLVGAGIAGLASARALVDAGYEVRVLEREATLRAQGTGLTLWPNAARALRSLGLEQAVTEHGQAIREAATRAPDGRFLARLPIAEIERRYGSLRSVHRAEFLIAADLVVGADGTGSVVRELVAPGAERLRGSQPSSSPPHSSGATSAVVWENVQLWPARSSTVYWRSPHGLSVGTCTIRAPVWRECR